MGLLSRRYLFKRFKKRLAAFFFDLIGSILFLPARLFRRPLQDREVKRILAVRLDHLGDVIMVQPALTALKRRFPQAEIDLLIPQETAAVFRDFPDARKIIGFSYHWFSRKIVFPALIKEFWQKIGELKKEHYDLAVDFRGDLRNILLLFFSQVPHRIGYGVTGGGFLLTQVKKYDTRKHQVLLNMNLVEENYDLRDIRLEPFQYSREEENGFWKGAGSFLNAGPRTRIVVHPGAGYPSKRWPGERYVELVKRLLAPGSCEIVIIGGESEKELADFSAVQDHVVDLRGKTSLRELLVLLDHSDLFIGNDSGPAHLAAAQGLLLVMLFSGTNDFRTWHPWTQRLEAVRHEVPCSPCHSQVCPLGHHDCLQKIEVTQVFERARNALSKLKETA